MRTIHEVEESNAPMTQTGNCIGDQSNGELEAEVSSLKEKLKAAHAAVARTHAHMEAQKKRTKQLVAAWKVRLEEGEEKLNRHKQFLDNQLQSIVSELLLFESALRREQKDIKHDLQDKDLTISTQKRTIDALLTSNVALTKALKKLKRKYKDATQYSNNNENISESSRLIQREADALISQIFASNHSFLSNQSISPFKENPLEKQDSLPEDLMADEEVVKEDRLSSSSPHVFFCLTESKDENLGSSVKLVTNTSSIPLPKVYQSDMEATFSIRTPSPTQTNQEPNLGIYEEPVHCTPEHVKNLDVKETCIKDHCIEEEDRKIQHSIYNIRRPPLVSTKSCPNLGLSVIEEDFQLNETDHDKSRIRSDSAELLNYDDYENEYDPFSESYSSDVFTSSYNSVGSLNSLERSYSVGTGSQSFEEGIYESLQEASDNAQGRPLVSDGGTRASPESDEWPPDESKWKQVKSPTRVSSFNLLKRIRRPRDLKKKQKAARTASDGDQLKDKKDRQRKLTL